MTSPASSPASSPRRRTRRLAPPFVLASAVVALLLGACAELPASVDSALDDEERTVLELVNEARARGATCGDRAMPPAPALAADPVLVRVAQKHAEDMLAAGEMTHTTPEGAVHYDPGTRFDARIAAEGYAFRTAGENVAWGYASPESVVAGWLGSAGHCRNILNPAFTEIGIGEEERFWAQVFAAPR